MSEIRGVGLDLCEIDRMREHLEDRFLEKYFTAREAAYIRARGAQAAASMAGVWAAKEAVLKAMGTGLNVHRGAYPPELAGRAAALEEFAPPPLRRAVLARYLAALERLVDALEREGFDAIRGAYEACSCTLGQRVQVSGATELTGVAEAFDETGALLVRTADGGMHRVLSGDVSVRGVMGYV